MDYELTAENYDKIRNDLIEQIRNHYENESDWEKVGSEYFMINYLF